MRILTKNTLLVVSNDAVLSKKRCNLMTKYFLILIIFSLFFSFEITFSQNVQNEKNTKFLWNIDFYTFIDNQEFAKSDFIKDKTLNGVNIAPQAGISWQKTDSKGDNLIENSVVAGINLLKEFGTEKIIDKALPIIYYKNRIKLKNHWEQSFYAGIFPRKHLFSNYCDLLFWQLLTNYIPAVQGFYCEFRKENNFVNAWIDWTGKPTESVNESFYTGLSMRANFKSYFIDFQGYYFHFANTNPKKPDFNLCDNGQALLSIGYNLFSANKKIKFAVSNGILAGYERERNVDNQQFLPIGFIANANFEIANFGLNNLLYAGDKRLRLYKKYGEQLYCANPFLQGNFYLQSEIYWQPFHSQTVNGKIGLLTHFSQGKVMFEQRFVLSIFLRKL